MRHHLSILLLAAAACTDADGARTAHELPAVKAEVPGVWSGRSASGVPVDVQVEPTRPRPGEVVFWIYTAGVGGQGTVWSIDLVSPSMPLHGVIRFPVRQSATGEYHAVAHIPMEGRWLLYVNLDEEGSDAAMFGFDVPESAGAPGHRVASDAGHHPPEQAAEGHSHTEPATRAATEQMHHQPHDH